VVLTKSEVDPIAVLFSPVVVLAAEEEPTAVFLLAVVWSVNA